MTYITNPNQIEEESFRIITKEAGDLLTRFSEDELKIVKRIIHTTADFEYASLVEFHPDAISIAKRLLKNGTRIYADTSMIKHGVNCKSHSFGIEIINYVHDKDVYQIAEQEGITRSMAGIQKAIDENIQIYAIGNAPTAIFKLKELIDSGYQRPELIIGVPVGFVGASESKALLSKMDIPYIRINGRKGGSPIAATIINAILKMI